MSYSNRVLQLTDATDKQKAIAYHNLGEAYIQLDQPIKAIDNLNNAYVLNTSIGKRSSYLFQNLFQKGNAYLLQNEPRKAIDFYLKALDVDSAVRETPGMYEIYYQLQLAGFATNDQRTKQWGERYSAMNKAFLKKQQEVLVNQLANVFENDVARQMDARRAEIDRDQALLKWISILTGLIALSLAYILIRKNRKAVELQEMDYDEAVTTARNLLLDNYHKIYGAYDKYLADQRCTFTGKKETLRKAMSLNGDYRNAQLVEYVLNDLGEGKFKVKS